MEDGLVVTLRVVAQFVGDTCKKGFQSLHEGGNVASFQVTHEAGDVEAGLVIGDLRVEGYQETEKTVSHLIIGEAERVELYLAVVVLNSQVAALLNHGERVACLCTIFGKGGRGDFHAVGQQAKVVVALLQ